MGVITENEVRLSYSNLIEPRAVNDGDKPTYATAILIPKKLADGSENPDVALLKKAISEAAADGVTKKWGGKRPANLRVPLRDGDAEKPEDETYAGMWFMNGKGPKAGEQPPVLLAKNGVQTTSPEIVYSGVYGRVQVNFYPYDSNGNKGVGCGIQSFISSEYGDPLANVVTADSARAAFGVSTPASEAKAAFAGETGSTSEAEDPANDDLWNTPGA